MERKNQSLSKKTEFRLKVTVRLQVSNFLQIWSSGSKLGRILISDISKKMKKTKYWWRNGDFSFSPEVKVYFLIDCPMRNQPRRFCISRVN